MTQDERNRLATEVAEAALIAITSFRAEGPHGMQPVCIRFDVEKAIPAADKFLSEVMNSPHAV